MTHDLIPVRDKLLKSNAYVASKGFRSAFSWYSQKNNHILVDSVTNANAVLAVVGKVLESRLECSASGNFHKREYETLEKAKYQLLLGTATDTVFASDFDVAVNNLNTFQTDVATWADRENLIVYDRRQKTLRFTRDVFEERRTAIADSDVDEVTDHWPVAVDLRSRLDDIKCTHRAVPLRVFSHGKSVDIRDIEDTIRGAIVELQFELMHYSIQPKKMESYNASVQQIQILQPGKSRPATAFKRQDISEGPIQVSESVAGEREQFTISHKKARMKSPEASIEEDRSLPEHQASTSAKKLGKRAAKESDEETHREVESDE